MTVRPATGRYGMYLDTSTSDYVECCQCCRRFVGGDFTSRLQRWMVHAAEDGCQTARARGAVQ